MAVYGGVRVLTWNLSHGRAQPAAGRDLLAEFCAMLAGWEWDVVRRLTAHCDTEGCCAMTFSTSIE